MLKELSEDFIPEIMPHREVQLKIIRETFKQFKDEGCAQNLIILGTTGAGKTSILKKVTSEQNNHIYLSALEYNTTHKILKKLTKQKTHSNSDLQLLFLEEMKINPKILIIDEAGKIDNIEEFSNFLNMIWRSVKIPIILATNKWTFIQDMPTDARLTLFFHKVELPSYDANQMKDIIISRTELINNLKIPEKSIEYLSAKIVKEHLSSVRIALLVLSRVVASNDFSTENIDKKLEDICEQDWIGFLHKLNPMEKKFLNVVLDLTEEKIEISSQEIATRMSDEASPSRVSQLISAFSDYGIIKCEYKNLGRAGGKYRLLSFVSMKVRAKLLKLLVPWDRNV